MSLEQIAQINEKVELFEDIVKAEKAELSPEYLPMWNAENNACFPHFINFANENLSNLMSLGIEGDTDSIEDLSIEYQKFRNGIEADLMEYSPQLYEQYIEAVGDGDEDNAALYMNEYINQTSKEIDEDDDD